MTPNDSGEAQNKLDAFFAAQEPPAFDRAFAARAHAALQRRQLRDGLVPWAVGAIVLAVVLGFAGDILLQPLASLAPIAAPLAIIWSVLLVTGRLPKRLF